MSIIHILVAAVILSGSFIAALKAGEPTFPVKVSENGRYFTDSTGEPVFWLGTTQWQLCRDFTLGQARTILAKSKEHGFVFVQVMLVGVGNGTKPNVRGDKPWLNDNPLTPNESYFRHVDAVLDAAREMNLVVALSVFHQENRKFIHAGNARAWAKWVAHRYRTLPNLIWMTAPEARPSSLPVLREIAAGLREGDDGLHLITLLPDPAPFSSSFLHKEEWLRFNSIQTWKSVELIYPLVTKDYQLEPMKPVLMAEGAYERGSEYGFEVTPLWIRRQAYYSFLTGAHHAYGHNDSWRVLPTWKEALEAPGARQMKILRRIFLERDEWWHLVPDQTILASGGNTNGPVLNLAARHKDRRWVIIYLGDKSSFSLHPQKVGRGKSLKANWVDPKNGETRTITDFAANAGKMLTTPADWEDAILIIDSE